MNILSLGAEVQDRSSELVPKILPLLCMFFSENKKKVPENIRPLNPSGFGIFSENKQGRHYLPPAHGNEVQNSFLLHHALVLCTQ